MSTSVLTVRNPTAFPFTWEGQYMCMLVTVDVGTDLQSKRDVHLTHVSHDGLVVLVLCLNQFCQEVLPYTCKMTIARLVCTGLQCATLPTILLVEVPSVLSEYRHQVISILHPNMRGVLMTECIEPLAMVSPRSSDVDHWEVLMAVCDIEITGWAGCLSHWYRSEVSLQCST